MNQSPKVGKAYNTSVRRRKAWSTVNRCSRLRTGAAESDSSPGWPAFPGSAVALRQ
jgi:hypothetical protein